MKSVGPRQAGINVTPYIDILLVLLIIFMVIQPTVQFELPSRVPGDAGPATRATAALLQIETDGQLQFNGEPLSHGRLGEALFGWFKGRANRNIFVSAPEDTPFGLVVGVIDVAKGAGAGDVGLLSSERFQPEDQY